jgi:hypothetical protein
MSRPYLFHYAASFSRSHHLSVEISRTELHKAGFEISSAPAAWEQFAINADTLVLVSSVPLSSSNTYVHVVATSNLEEPAKRWSAKMMQAIKQSKMVMTDRLPYRRAVPVEAASSSPPLVTDAPWPGPGDSEGG